MKSFGLIVLSIVLAVSATPLGDRQVARRHNGVPLSRRYVLQSRTDAPAACVAAAPPAIPSGTVATPDPTATDLPTPDSSSPTDPSLATPPAADNSTAVATPADNSTSVAAPADNSTVAANSTAPASRRFWARHGFSSGFDSGFDTSFDSSFDFDFSEIDEFSFEEEATTFVSTWESLCFESGGDIITGDPCNTFGGEHAYSALLETADVCEQQVIADSMITFAKSSGIRNRDSLIHFALGFRRHPRRSVEILGFLPSSLYCLDAPTNTELVGVYQEQLQGCNPGLFGSPSTPLVSFGSSGTCPSGMTADVSTCGCLGSDGTTDISDGVDMSSDSTDSSDSTGSSDSTDSTGSLDSSDSSATSTDSSDASSTDSASTATATDDSVAPPPPSATDINAQPSDISGNVNDPNGRR